MRRFWDIFEKVNFYAQNKLKKGPGAVVEFFLKSSFVTFEYLWWLNILQNIKKKLDHLGWTLTYKEQNYWASARV